MKRRTIPVEHRERSHERRNTAGEGWSHPELGPTEARGPPVPVPTRAEAEIPKIF